MTSSHHMALEMVIRRIKVILHEKREYRRLAEIERQRLEALKRQKEEEERLRKLK